MRPLGNIMYQNLLTWRGSTKEVVLQVKDDSPGAKKKTQDIKLKCDTETVKSIVKQMEEQAAKLAAEHRARRKFKIAQVLNFDVNLGKFDGYLAIFWQI